jgi:hypothetical protein
MFASRLGVVRSRIYHRFFKFPPHRRKHYETLCRRVHPMSYRGRRRLAAQLAPGAGSDGAGLCESDGYLVWSGDDRHHRAGAVVDEARSILEGGELDRMKGRCAETKMNFAVQRVDEGLRRDSPFLAFALDSRVVSMVAGYLGVVPVLDGIYLWYSPNENLNGDRNSSQLFHIDPTGYRQVKVFVHVEDVPEDGGPLTVVRAAASRRLYPLFAGDTGSISDEEVERVVGRESIVALTGSAGTVSAADTSTCFHFGSRPGNHDRLLVHFHFMSPFAPKFSFFGRRHNPRYAHLVSRDTPLVERYVLGAG